MFSMTEFVKLAWIVIFAAVDRCFGITHVFARNYLELLWDTSSVRWGLVQHM